MSTIKRRGDLMNALWANIQKDSEKAKRAKSAKDIIGALRGFMRPHQRKVEQDNSPLIALISPRQTGKSTWALLKATINCLIKANASWLVIGQTRKSVKKVYWADLQRISEMYELHIHFHHTELTATFGNGSIIYFEGLDKFDELEKLRGGRYHGAIVDECKSFPELTLKTLIEDILGPALLGQSGQLILIGTPGDVLRGEFYLATCEPPVLLNFGNNESDKRWSNWPYGKPKQDDIPFIWSFHRWTLQDNDVKFIDPRTNREFTLWEEALRKKKDKGWKDDHPTWRREYLGQWVATNLLLVYRYRPHIHDYVPQPNKECWGLPAPEGTQWRTAIGFDFGTKDGTGMVVWAWSPTFPGLWELYSEKRRTTDDLRLSVSAIARWYREVESLYGPFDGLVGDPAGLATMVIETLAVEHNIFVEAAEKREKVDHIELFNNDLDSGLIHIRKDSELSDELIGNQWLIKTIGTDKRKEDPATPNDLCDAGLYAFRWCRHRQSKPDEQPIAIGSIDWYKLEAKREMAEAIDKARHAKDSQLDKDWWPNEPRDFEGIS